jgi:hypothetical protein
MDVDLIHETLAPLAWDEHQMPFQLPPQAVSWKVRLFTGRPGRPPAVYGEHGVLHLGLDATVADLRRAVRGRPGHYRLYAVDAAGRELEPVACMEIVAEPQEPEVIGADDGDMTVVLREVIGLCTKMVASRDAHDQLINQVMTTLVTNTATIQRSTAALLGAANTTIQVANGVEALERQEPAQLDAGAQPPGGTSRTSRRPRHSPRRPSRRPGPGPRRPSRTSRRARARQPRRARARQPRRASATPRPRR